MQNNYKSRSITLNHLGAKLKVKPINSSLQWFEPAFPYHVHNDAVWGSSREDKTKVTRRSHQSSFILKTTREPKVKHTKHTREPVLLDKVPSFK